MEDEPATTEDAAPPQPMASPFRRHPARWALAAGGLATVLALGGYGVTQAATTSTHSETGGVATPGTGRQPSGSAPSGAPPGNAKTGSGSPSGSGPPSGTSRPGGTSGADQPSGAGGLQGIGGKVVGRSGDTITVTDRNDKTVTVKVTAATVYKDGGTTVTSSNLKTGDFAVVAGSTSEDGTVTATTITFGTSPPGVPG